VCSLRCVLWSCRQSCAVALRYSHVSLYVDAIRFRQTVFKGRCPRQLPKMFCNPIISLLLLAPLITIMLYPLLLSQEFRRDDMDTERTMIGRKICSNNKTDLWSRDNSVDMSYILDDRRRGGSISGDFSLLYSVQTGSGIHPAFYTRRTRHRVLAVAAVNRKLSMVWWRWHISVSQLRCCWSIAVSFWMAWCAVANNS
jgi:hypothetical protein